MLSFPAISGSQTNTVFGKPAEASTSTSTATASMPTRANVFNLASIGERLRGRRTLRAPFRSSHAAGSPGCFPERSLVLLRHFSAPRAFRRLGMEDQSSDGEFAGEEHRE